MFFLSTYIQSLIFRYCIIAGRFQFIIAHCWLCLLELFLELLLCFFNLVPDLKILFFKSFFRVFEFVLHLGLWLFKLGHCFIISSMSLIAYLLFPDNSVNFLQLSEHVWRKFLEFERWNNGVSFYTFNTEIIKLQFIKEIFFQFFPC